MNAMTFDSHEAALAYKGAGFTDAQVEALIAIDRKTMSLPDISYLATRAELQAEIKSLKTELLAAIETSKYQMLTGMIVAMAGLAAIVATIIKLVH